MRTLLIVVGWLACVATAHAETLEVRGDQLRGGAWSGTVRIEPTEDGRLSVEIEVVPNDSSDPYELRGVAASYDTHSGLSCKLRPTLGATGRLAALEQGEALTLTLTRDPTSGLASGRLARTDWQAWFVERGVGRTQPKTVLPTQVGHVLVNVDTTLRGGFGSRRIDGGPISPSRIALPRGVVTLYSGRGQPIGTVDLDRYRREGRVRRGLCYRQRMHDTLNDGRLGFTNYLCTVALEPKPEPAKRYLLAEWITLGSEGGEGPASEYPFGRLETTPNGTIFKITKTTLVVTKVGPNGEIVTKSAIPARLGERYLYVPGRTLRRTTKDGTHAYVFMELVPVR
jgi:hypothetical protein